MSSPARTERPVSPGIWSHAISLLMPFTMVVLVPWWLVARYGDTTGYWWPVGVALFVASLSLFVATVRLFMRVGKGTLAPWDPTKKLVVMGPYRYCRNPMISGVAGMILGEAVFFGSAALLMWAAIFLAVNTLYFVLFEEPALLQKFGDQYATYKRHVPRWVPRLRPYGG